MRELVVGSREKQFLRLFPKLKVSPVRGNVNTRLSKLDQGQYSMLILAAAGLKRLGLENRIGYTFGIDQMIPSAGQGIIVVQGRADQNYECLDEIFSEKSRKRVLAERAFIERLQGGCSTPTGAYAELIPGGMKLYGYFYNEETGKDGYQNVFIEDLDDETLIRSGHKLAEILIDMTSR